MAGTEHYNLFTPNGNETVAYQDFINENNQKIDEALFANQNSAATANENAQTALTGLEAANTNINNLQTEVTGYGIPDMKTEISAQDARIEALEDTVGNIDIQPVTLVKALDTPHIQCAYIKNGFFTLIVSTQCGAGASTFSANPYPGLSMIAPSNITLARNFINIEGNPVNLTENNYFVMPAVPIIHKTGQAQRCTLILYYNGVYTQAFADNMEGGGYLMLYANIPIIKANNVRD